MSGHGRRNKFSRKNDEDDGYRDIEVSSSSRSRRKDNIDIQAGGRRDYRSSNRHYTSNSHQYQSNDRHMDSHDKHYSSNDRHYHKHQHIYHYGGQSSKTPASHKIEKLLDDIAQHTQDSNDKRNELETLRQESEDAAKRERKRQKSISEVESYISHEDAHCVRQKASIRLLKPMADEEAGQVWWPKAKDRAWYYSEILNEPVIEEAGSAVDAAPVALETLKYGQEQTGVQEQIEFHAP